MSNMPEYVRLKWCHNPTDASDVYSVPVGVKGGTPYRPADAPPTMAEAMRCPEVRALVEALQSAQESIATFMGVHGHPKDSGAGLVLDEVSSALHPFTEGKDG